MSLSQGFTSWDFGNINTYSLIDLHEGGKDTFKMLQYRYGYKEAMFSVLFRYLDAIILTKPSLKQKFLFLLPKSVTN